MEIPYLALGGTIFFEGVTKAYISLMAPRSENSSKCVWNNGQLNGIKDSINGDHVHIYMFHKSINYDFNMVVNGALVHELYGTAYTFRHFWPMYHFFDHSNRSRLTDIMHSNRYKIPVLSREIFFRAFVTPLQLLWKIQKKSNFIFIFGQMIEDQVLFHLSKFGENIFSLSNFPRPLKWRD